MDALTPRESPKRDGSMVTTTATAASAKPEALGISTEGIVHGHIHNYNNMTYIHGHLHHSAAADDGGAAAATANTAFASDASHAAGSGGHANEKCKEYVDCQHFEFLNYHNNSSLAKYNDTETYKAGLKNGVPFAKSFNPVAAKLTGPQVESKKDLSHRKDSWFNDDLILLPSAKKSKPNPQSETDDCYCTPKILEICCDESHPTNASNTKQNKPDNSAKTFKPEDDNDVIIFTDVKNDYSMSNINLHDQYHNTSGHEAHDHNNSMPDSLSQLMSHLSEIDCNLTCDTPCATTTDLNHTQDSQPLNNDEVFQKYCKFCDEKTDNQPCPRHMHLGSKQPQLTPKLSSLTPPAKTVQASNHSYHEHILNSDMDLKILEDLCNISSLYEVPFGKHMSHHNHIHTGEVDPGMVNQSNGNQTMNLLLSSINRCDPKNNINSNINDNPLTEMTATDHQHHHHRIQLHSHKPNKIGNTSNPPAVPTTNTPADLTNSDLNELISREYSYERFKNQSEPPLPPKLIHQTQTNRRSWLTKDHESNDFSSLHNTLSSSVSPPVETTSTINFNWCFKEENNNDLKCKWKECPESCTSLFDLQRHLLKDHVSQDFKDSLEPLTCNWEDCDFLGDDTCSIVNHINSQHGINFDIQFANPDSFLQGGLSKEKHHLLHCPNPQTHEHSSGLALSGNDTTNTSPSEQLEQVLCQWDGCNKQFSNAQELNDHLESAHLTRGKSKYQCLWHDCHRTFPQRQKLIRHLKVHSKYKPYKCKTCKRCFSSEETLVQHTRTHSGEKPYKCHICDKKFAISSSLKIHIRTHTGEKPLQCKICGKRFNESSNLSKHIKTHKKKYKCADCSKSFDDLVKMNSHKVKCLLERETYL